MSTITWAQLTGMNGTIIPTSDELIGPFQEVPLNENSIIAATFLLAPPTTFHGVNLPFTLLSNKLWQDFTQLGNKLFQNSHSDLSMNVYLLMIFNPS